MSDRIKQSGDSGQLKFSLEQFVSVIPSDLFKAGTETLLSRTREKIRRRLVDYALDIIPDNHAVCLTLVPQTEIYVQDIRAFRTGYTLTMTDVAAKETTE